MADEKAPEVPAEQVMTHVPVDEKSGKPAEAQWDNVALNPNERKSIRDDPTGESNRPAKKKGK